MLVKFDTLSDGRPVVMVWRTKKRHQFDVYFRRSHRRDRGRLHRYYCETKPDGDTLLHAGLKVSRWSYALPRASRELPRLFEYDCE